MQLNDFLNKPEFVELKKTLVSEMHFYAEQNLLKKMNDVFGSEEKAMDWFYSPSFALINKRPYDWCKSGGSPIVYDELINIEHGIFS